MSDEQELSKVEELEERIEDLEDTVNHDHPASDIVYYGPYRQPQIPLDDILETFDIEKRMKQMFDRRVKSIIVMRTNGQDPLKVDLDESCFKNNGNTYVHEIGEGDGRLVREAARFDEWRSTWYDTIIESVNVGQDTITIESKM